MPATAFGGFVDLQEILGKSIAWPEECHLCAKVAARELGRAGCQGIIKMGQMVLTMWMESSDLAPSCTCRLLGVSSQQRKKGACQHFHPGALTTAPPSLALKLSSSAPPPHISGAFWAAAMCWSSSWVTLQANEPMHRPSRSSMLKSIPAHCLSQTQALLVFTARCYGNFFSWHWCPEVLRGNLCMGGPSHP